jgi:putative DNA primase/helicase
MLNGSDGAAFDRKGDGFTFSDEPEETLEQTLARLAKFRPLQYDQVRQAEADRLGVRVTTLDAEVAKARGDSEIEVGQGRKLTIAPPIPWPEPVNGSELLNDIARFLSRYVFLPPGAADAIAAWTLHTFCFERFRHHS